MLHSPLAARRQVHGPLAVGGGGAAVSNGLLNALIAFWPGNEVSGNALDLHTNALHLTDVNTVTSNPGLAYPLARQYTRVNTEYHTRPGSDALLVTGDIDFTLGTWVYLNSKPTQQYFVAKYKNFAPQAIEYGIGHVGGVTDRFFCLVGNGLSGVAGSVFANSFGSPSLNAWHLVLMWHDSVANTINIQVNTAVDSAASGAPGGGTAIFRIGNLHTSATGFPVDGRIGPTMLWKSAPGGGGVLTAAQRTALYNGGAGLPYSAFTS